MYLKALLGYERVFGKDHPKCGPLRDTLTALGRVGNNNNALLETNLVQGEVYSQDNVNACPSQPRLTSSQYRILKKLG